MIWHMGFKKNITSAIGQFDYSVCFEMSRRSKTFMNQQRANETQIENKDIFSTQSVHNSIAVTAEESANAFHPSITCQDKDLVVLLPS